jgi:hypothetical protein
LGFPSQNNLPFLFNDIPTFKIITNGNYNDESLKKTTRVVNRGVPINMITHHFGISIFLKDKFNGKNKYLKCKKDGTLFTKEEQVVHWVLEM